MATNDPADSHLDREPELEPAEKGSGQPTDSTFFGHHQYKLALARIDHYWKQQGKKDLEDVVLLDAKALGSIDYKGVQEFKDRLRDAFRAAGKRGAEAYAKAVYEEMTEGDRKFGVAAYLTTQALPNDPNLKPGEYGKFFYLAKNGDKLELSF